MPAQSSMFSDNQWSLASGYDKNVSAGVVCHKTKGAEGYVVSRFVDQARSPRWYAEPVYLFSNEYQNDTDTMTDYFEKGRVRLTKGHPLFEAALARAEANEAKADARRAKRNAA